MRNLRKNATTLDDVARSAGVSKYTVSAVLNNTKSNTRVSEATRKAIFDAAASLQYRPNAIALSLRNRRTNLIGLYVGYEAIDARNRFLSEILGGLQQGCDEYAQDLVLFRSFKNMPVDHVHSALVDGKVDGLVLYAPSNDILATTLSDSHMPVVAVADGLPDLTSVVINDEHGGALQAEHLAERQHRYVLYRAPLHTSRSIARRLQGFLDRAEQFGMTVEVGRPPVVGFSYLSADELRLLTAPTGERPTAVACWEDGHAEYLLGECRKLGLRVPEDLAVIGFDGIETGREPAWHLTTIRAPWIQVAKLAVTQLMRQIAGETVEPETVLPVSLDIGNTT